MDSSSEQNIAYDLALKILIIGDSGVGKTSLVLSFTSKYTEYSAPTIGVDFKIKYLTVGGKKLKLTIWDTAGQERFRTLISSYYRSAQGILLVYDVTRRETFTNLTDVWTKEVDLYSTNKNCIKMLVGNKVDKESERVVSREEGIELAKQLGCLFYECSAKTKKNVDQCFQELALKIMKGPGDSGVGKTSLVLSFTAKYTEYSAPTIGVDFKIKYLTVGGKRLKLTIWDTAGQERFRTLITSYYRAAQGILLVYDVTRKETFTNLSDVWTKEIDLYSTNKNCIKMLVGNKVDKESERAVSREEGIELAKQLGCLFYECSAKTKENVDQCFHELALKTYPCAVHVVVTLPSMEFF
ncbi:Ras-related protein RABC2a [Camellia lanceoleosa]|uniref:Ras-related protein RABC2a n=1 Tax=Camellia lanceoleosa TaxID=1840588 RepID=A0ACC0HTW2_9ERIC|nr:Ras-related protein RABC2a [Camellia lanceoleosa]